MVELGYNTGVVNRKNVCRGDVISIPRHVTRKDKFLMPSHSTRTPFFPTNLDQYAPWVAIHGLVAPYGECQCGCGQKTNISNRKTSKSNVRKNDPLRFAPSHTSLICAADNEHAPWVRQYGLTAPYGKCQCGCGEDAPIARQGDKKIGTVKGEPKRYLHNHSQRNLSLEDSFWEFIVAGSPDQCWEWSGTCFSNGYGSVSFQCKRWPAHRVSWEIHNGPIPDGLWVLHKCDNRPCCNPNHLFLGTPADNMADKVAKGRHRNGSSPKRL